MKACVALALVLAAASAVPAVAQTSRGAPACGELPKTWEGTAYAASGDSLSGVDLKNTIKLWGIRAAEMPSVAGMRSRAALEDMLGSGENKVSCRMTCWDFACRAVAQPHDIALRLAEDGWVYGAGLNEPPSWDKDASAKVAHFESIARQARKGLWPHWLGEEPKP